VFCSVLQRVAVCCSVKICQCTIRLFRLVFLQRGVCSSVLQCVAVCCNVLQCVEVCCIVLYYKAVRACFPAKKCVLQCVAVCCSVLQCIVLSGCSGSFFPRRGVHMSHVMHELAMFPFTSYLNESCHI